MKQKFIQYITEEALFSPGAHLLVGVSGGADSVCLLRLLYEIKEEWELTLSVVHMNHGIRGQEADEDAIYVAQLAKRWELPFFLLQKDVPAIAKKRGLTEEEAGRELRYQEFERIRKEQGADWIAVAHHQDDQAETVLFQLLRGSGMRGLTGMSPKRGHIIRPLLGMSRYEIEQYLKRENITYRQDSTNEDLRYARNYIRKELLPQMEYYLNKQVVRHLADVAGDARQWCNYIEGQAQAAIERILQKESEETISLDIKAFFDEDKVIGDEVLRAFFSVGIKGVKDVSRAHYRQVCELLHKETGKRIYLPEGIVVERRYDRLVLHRLQAGEAEPFFLECEVPSVNIVDMNGENSRITFAVKNRCDLPQEIPQKDYTKWFDYDMIKDSLVLRNPREGDYLTIDEEGHRKKLSRYYIDQKLPMSERKRQFVLAEGNRILWALPGRIGTDYKITDRTKRVLVVSMIRELAIEERIHHERRDSCID